MESAIFASARSEFYHGTADHVTARSCPREVYGGTSSRQCREGDIRARTRGVAALASLARSRGTARSGFIVPRAPRGGAPFPPSGRRDVGLISGGSALFSLSFYLSSLYLARSFRFALFLSRTRIQAHTHRGDDSVVVRRRRARVHLAILTSCLA